MKSTSHYLTLASKITASALSIGFDMVVMVVGMGFGRLVESLLAIIASWHQSIANFAAI